MPDKFYGSVRAGSENVTITALLRSSTSNEEVTGKLAADITARYWRQGSTPVDITVSDLSSLELGHADGGWKEVGNGLYRFDVPDEAWEDGSDWVVITVISSGCFVFHERYNLETDEDVVIDGGENDVTASSYASRSIAQTYFDGRLNTSAWDDASDSDKDKSLIMATRAIDRLNFSGDKTDEDQELEFPRTLTNPDETTEDIGTPINIVYATCEIALAYLDGYEDEPENKNINILRNQFDKVSTTYGTIIQEHLRNGIPSIVAWNYLIPYLRDVRRVNLNRVS